jgi:hypothetical protein
VRSAKLSAGQQGYAPQTTGFGDRSPKLDWLNQSSFKMVRAGLALNDEGMAKHE